MKLLLAPSNLEQLDYVKDLVDAYIVGLKGMSVNFALTVNLEELKSILKKYPLKKCFLAINKNMKNGDLPILREYLKELRNYPLEAILISDPAVLCLFKEEYDKIPFSLCWAAEHATTNRFTIEYWQDLGYSMSLLSNELTIDEIKNIKDTINIPLITQVFGYIPIFVSKRHLVSNYKNYFKLKDNSKVYYMEKEGIKSPILETTDGTQVYFGKILNGYNEYEILKNIDMDYALFQGIFIKKEVLKDVITCFKKRLTNERVEMLLDYNTTNGFFNQEAIYTVKKS